MSIPLAPAVRSIYENGAPEGERNNQLFKLACQFRDQGMSIEDAEVEAESWALKVGLTQKEAISAVKSAYSRPGREPWVPASRYGIRGMTVYREAAHVPAMPQSSNEDAIDRFLAHAFRQSERIHIDRAILDGERERPSGRGETRTREEWLELFKDGGLATWQGDAVGVYVCINPIKGNRRVLEEIQQFRHVLVEFDKGTIEEQWEQIKKAKLPTSCIIRSGGKSLHAWVVVNAANADEFKERAEFVYKHLENCKGLDGQNKDAPRFSRLPGAIRRSTGNGQELVEVAEEVQAFEDWREWTIVGDLPTPFKWDDMLAFDKAKDETTLLGDRWLCRGGSALWVGSSGLGKSVLCLQAAITWAYGGEFFGIKPKRPLKSIIVQAENDAGDVSETVRGIIDRMALSQEERKLVFENVIIVQESFSTGARFADLCRRLASKHKPDLFWVDPLLSFIGGDISKQETASVFLRNELNPVSHSHGFAWCLIHHSGKPPKDAASAYQGFDKMYWGLGSSELTNWARTVITLNAVKSEDNDHFVLEVVKRGRRSGLVPSKPSAGITASKALPRVFLRHATDSIAWIEADEPEKRGAGRPEKVIKFEDYLDDIRPGISAGHLQELIMVRADVGREKAVKTTGLWEHGDKAKGAPVRIKNVGQGKAKKYVPFDVMEGHV
jgi:RecA-family ATPase